MTSDTTVAGGGELKTALRRGVPLFGGWAFALGLWQVGAPSWCLGAVALLQVAAVAVSSLGLTSTRAARLGLVLTVFYLLSLVLLPLLAVETSRHEADPVWRLPSATEEP